ncbi:hypothetical protein ACRALDRAFT_1062660 [Sodiomyces alcalophilus JCM 7366]|uniref:uncharacterized protein n=1 Tax=Sodiomyces alcalophilus JCM 7366 TaxID=591952 RepID=UPI0039B5E66E
MGYVGVSLIVASVVWVLVAPPPWLHPYLPTFLLPTRREPPALLLPSKGSSPPPDTAAQSHDVTAETNNEGGHVASADSETPRIQVEKESPGPPGADLSPASAPHVKAAKDRAAMPPPPVIRTSNAVPTLQSPPQLTEPEDEQTTPKAVATTPNTSVPSFSLSDESTLAQPAEPPSITTPSSSPASSMMPPPPLPIKVASASAPRPSFPMAGSPQVARAPGAAPPRLQPMTPSSVPSSVFPRPNSQQIARGPAPNRIPPGAAARTGPSSSSSSSLAPPPTHNQPPQKPSRKVLLPPGHSPLDWARISGPTADLRNLPPDTPYLKVTPSMLKRQSGRRGTDAWTAFGGRVYNISPYADYHPGGRGELLRCAGKDGTRLFAEVHPWVNYETMLSACLVGVLVPEEEGARESEMDEMD